MTICEHCGASVHGDVCEYCDMPVKNIKPAPSEMIYKKIKPAKSLKQKITAETEKHLNHIKARKEAKKHKPKLRLNRRGRKFLRFLLFGGVSAFAICAITTGMAINYNVTRTYIQPTVEYAIEQQYREQPYIEHHHSYNYDYGYDYDYDYEYEIEDESEYEDDYCNDAYYDYDGYLIEEDMRIDEDIPVEEARPVYNANEILQENGVFPSGTYQIGVDIPEGRYIFIPELSDGHGVEGVYADPDCENQISSAYVHFDGTRIAEISGRGYLDFSWCTAYNLDMYPEIVNDPHKTDGMFIVGRDIPAGTYRIVGYGEYEDMAEWYIYSSINAVGAITKYAGTLDNYDDYYGRNYAMITLNDGEYFELRHCIIGDLHS